MRDREGIAAAAAVKAGKTVDFPTTAIEINAGWELIAAADRRRFREVPPAFEFGSPGAL